MTRPLALDQEAIAARIPHGGAMCLLDRVVEWDGQRIECTAISHRDDQGSVHPLAQQRRLPSTAAIEYAAQAMALHGRLVQEHLSKETDGCIETDGRLAAPRRGFLAGLRSVHLSCRWIEPDWPPLTIKVERFAGDDVQVLYDFEVRASGPIARGRAVVVLDASARGATTA